MSVLMKEGAWRLEKMNNPDPRGLQSFIVHDCLSTLGKRYWYGNRALDSRCVECKVPPPASMRAAWRLHNWEHIEAGV